MIMCKKYLIIFFLFFVASCNRLKGDFFHFIFKVDSLSVSRVCSDNPSFFSEGRFFEMYSIPEKDLDRIVKSITRSPLSRNTISEYPEYENPIWKATPIKGDSILQFIHTQMIEKENKCFDESTIKEVLQREGNFYLPLRDRLGRTKLFILDTKTAELFLLTSYIL